MLDFIIVVARSTKQGIEVYPKFIMKKSNDLMIRGGDFYAIWDEDRGIWSTDEQDVIRLIDNEVRAYMDEHKDEVGPNARGLYMWDAESGIIDRWHKYCQKQMRDHYRMLDERLIFSNTEVTKEDYASKKLNYPLEHGNIDAWDKLVSTLYSEEERIKIEWAIGSIVSGDSKEIQKFMVLYGEAGAGKSTIMNIIQQLFNGYYSVFDAKALGSSSNQFALEAFKNNPLVAIQHDGDLSRIEDNTRLNSVVSHELMTVNEKFKSAYENRFNCFLFMGSNKPVKITDAKSGLIRRLIDVTPSGNKLSLREYNRVMKQITFELGAIAYHCYEVYKDDPNRYDNYVPLGMMSATNDFYNFMYDSYYIFENDDGVSLKAAWEMYKTYCEEAKVAYPHSKRSFQEELKSYFKEFNDRYTMSDGTRVRSYYSGFKVDKFGETTQPEPVVEDTRNSGWLDLKPPASTVFDKTSVFDTAYLDCPAQYANSKGTPDKAWSKNLFKLSDLDTSSLHFVKVPINHIVIDFDIRGSDGNKSLEQNIEAANKWPATYAEVSKSGAGIHLHYIYAGDPERLSRIYDDNIEVKVFTGKSSLRRKLTLCNDLPIATINSGLPLKGEDKVVNFEGVRNEKAIRTSIKRNLNKEIHASTKCSIDFIFKILEDAYKSGIPYDVSDMKNAIVAFASGSTNQWEYCLKLVEKMKFQSEEAADYVSNDEKPIVFFDVEVFPNLFLVNWKFQGKGKPVVRMINPTSAEIEGLLKFRLIGFNNRGYDNHMLYARLMGYNNEQMYNLSKKIVGDDKDVSRNAKFREAYNLSYTDVHDFSNTKQSLKKWEIQLGIHHQELGLPWDQPVPEEMWTKVAEYCDNDVIATEAVFDFLKADWIARQILADLADGSVNDSTNTLTAKIIFGNNRNPQDQFNYRNMGEKTEYVMSPEGYDEYTMFDGNKPIFPGYKYEFGKSTYRDEETGEGGYVYAEQAIHTNVALLDVESMHPASIEAEELFGPIYTPAFIGLRKTRLAVKHEDLDYVRSAFNGKLIKYLTGEYTLDDLSYALKIPINMVYGQTSAKYDNAFKDPRNVDNIVAKRGALFMINLKHEVQKRGYTVAHIKTDSIKIPNADMDIINFVSEYGKLYGYTFEHEATYDRMCLVNDAVYIAKYASPEYCEETYGYVPKENRKHPGEWTATGAQFAVPYVFKKLFSKEPIAFEDMCETKQVSTALYLGSNDADSPNFVGRVGLFCPIKPGCGGSELLRESRDADGNVKYGAPTGTKGYFWLESEMVKELKKEGDIDRSYYDKQVDTAVETISKYGDFEWFISDDAPKEPEYLATADTPPWLMPCGDNKYQSCIECPNYSDNTCGLGYDITKILHKGE